MFVLETFIHVDPSSRCMVAYWQFSDASMTKPRLGDVVDHTTTHESSERISETVQLSAVDAVGVKDTSEQGSWIAEKSYTLESCGVSVAT